MKKNKILLLLFFGSFIYTSAYAQQGEFRAVISYNVAMPTGAFKDIIDKTSFRGWDGLIAYGITDKMAVGLNVGFQDFYEKFPRAVYHLPDGSDISAVVTNSVQIVPLLANVRYKFMSGMIRPYVAAGIGGSFVINRQFVGEYESSENRFRFALRPELGVHIAFSNRPNGVGMVIGANYNYINYNSMNIDNLNHIGIKAGISVPLQR